MIYVSYAYTVHKAQGIAGCFYPCNPPYTKKDVEVLASLILKENKLDTVALIWWTKLPHEDLHKVK